MPNGNSDGMTDNVHGGNAAPPTLTIQNDGGVERDFVHRHAFPNVERPCHRCYATFAHRLGPMWFCPVTAKAVTRLSNRSGQSSGLGTT